MVNILSLVLSEHARFDKVTVKGALQVLAHFIDWNEITHFNSCWSLITSQLRAINLRSGAFACLSAVVGKGMGEVDKLNVIREAGFLDEVNQAEYHYLKSYE